MNANTKYGDGVAVTIQLGGKDYKFVYMFAYSFSQYDPRWNRNSITTFATVRRIPAQRDETLPIKDFASVAVCCPKDRSDFETGKRLALRRAVLRMFFDDLIFDYGCKHIIFRDFWKMFRTARYLAENPQPIHADTHICHD